MIRKQRSIFAMYNSLENHKRKDIYNGFEGFSCAVVDKHDTKY